MPKSSKAQTENDRKNVIEYLMKNPSCTVPSISENCGLSTQQVYRILRDLESEGIVYGNPLMLNFAKLGMNRYIIFARRSGIPSDQTTLNSSLYSKEFLDSLKEHKIDIIPEDDYTCTGAFDMVTVFLAHNITDANKYLDFLRHTSKGYFNSCTISEVLFTTRKNMINTPERQSFIEYIQDISAYGTSLEVPDENDDDSQ